MRSTRRTQHNGRIVTSGEGAVLKAEQVTTETYECHNCRWPTSNIKAQVSGRLASGHVKRTGHSVERFQIVKTIWTPQ